MEAAVRAVIQTQGHVTPLSEVWRPAHPYMARNDPARSPEFKYTAGGSQGRCSFYWSNYWSTFGAIEQGDPLRITAKGSKNSHIWPLN